MKVFKLGVAAASLFIATRAEAGNLTADCSGWEDSGTWKVDCPAIVTATALLEVQDASGLWVTVETSVATANLAPNSTFAVGGSWSTALGGTYRVSLEFSAQVMCSETAETWVFNAAFGPFDCAGDGGGGGEDNSARTPGYWKNHPESWPVTSLTIGGQVYSQACLLDVMSLPTRGDVRIRLIAHLIAAKLNLLPNSIEGIGSTDPSIQPTVDAADQFLIDTGTTIDCATLTLTGELTDEMREASNSLKDALDAYNNNLEIGTSSSPLTAREESGCSAAGGGGSIGLLLPLIALRLRRRHW
jgi:uncharacterized protein (TIGR03382 family)